MIQLLAELIEDGLSKITVHDARHSADRQNLVSRCDAHPASNGNRLPLPGFRPAACRGSRVRADQAHL